jgi:aminoglycoside phosphotransferase (APT) family kinase protein
MTFVKVIRNSRAEHYVIRVPAHGTEKLWTVEDKYMMERQVDMMRYIRSHTKVPVAEIFHYDTDRDNTMGMP